jgi:hypothetical protein
MHGGINSRRRLSLGSLRLRVAHFPGIKMKANSSPPCVCRQLTEQSGVIGTPKLIHIHAVMLIGPLEIITTPPASPQLHYATKEYL